MLARLVLFVAAYFLVVHAKVHHDLGHNEVSLEELSQPTLFPEKQIAKRSIALKLAEQNSLDALSSSTTTSWSDITSAADVPPSEYYMVSIDLGYNSMPSNINIIPQVKKITQIGTLYVILVKGDQSRDAVLYELRSNGFFNYQVQKSYQHPLSVQNTLDRLDQPDLPLDNSYTPIGTGVGTHIYFIGTGILSTHVEFAGRYVLDYVVDGEPSTPCNSHETGVASVAAGATIGVAPLATVHDLKVGVAAIGCSTYTSHVVDALAYIYANGSLPGVINLSLQGPGNSILDAVIGQLYSMGFFIVAAAGNAASATAPCLNSPARAPFAISVGAFDDTDTLSYFSNFGDCVDIYALGSSVPAADSSADDAYAVVSGTSISTPVVSGTAAVLISLLHLTDSSQVADSIRTSAIMHRIDGIPSDVSSNRMVSIYKYELNAGATTTSAEAGRLLSLF